MSTTRLPAPSPITRAIAQERRATERAESLRARVCATLRKTRRRRGVTLAGLERLTGINRGSIHRLEAGQYHPEHAARVAEALASVPNPDAEPAEASA